MTVAAGLGDLANLCKSRTTGNSTSAGDGDSQSNHSFTLPAGRVERSEGRGRAVGIAVWKVLLTLSPPRPLSRPTLPRGEGEGQEWELSGSVDDPPALVSRPMA